MSTKLYLGGDFCVFIVSAPKTLLGRELLRYLNLKKSFKCKNRKIDCCICQDNVKQNEFVRELNCGHKYHKKCVDNWMIKMSQERDNISCPICRQEIELK